MGGGPRGCLGGLDSVEDARPVVAGGDRWRTDVKSKGRELREKTRRRYSVPSCKTGQRRPTKLQPNDAHPYTVAPQFHRYARAPAAGDNSPRAERGLGWHPPGRRRGPLYTLYNKEDHYPTRYVGTAQLFLSHVLRFSFPCFFTWLKWT